MKTISSYYRPFQSIAFFGIWVLEGVEYKYIRVVFVSNKTSTTFFCRGNSQMFHSSQTECCSNSKLLLCNCTIPSSGEYKWLLEKAIQSSLETHKDFCWVQWGLGENAEIIRWSNILFYSYGSKHIFSFRKRRSKSLSSNRNHCSNVRKLVHVLKKENFLLEIQVNVESATKMRSDFWNNAICPPKQAKKER